jgi:hypothetical protein
MITKVSRRRLITTGLATPPGVSLAIAAGIADRYGLLAPDHTAYWGQVKQSPTALRLLTSHHSRPRIPSQPEGAVNQAARRLNPTSCCSPFRGLASHCRRHGFRRRHLLLDELKRMPSQTNITSGLRRSLVFHSRVDRRSALLCVASSGRFTASQVGGDSSL